MFNIRPVSEFQKVVNCNVSFATLWSFAISNGNYVLALGCEKLGGRLKFDLTFIDDLV